MFTKEWLLARKVWLIARIKETSTKYGVTILAALAALVFTTEQVGDFSTRLDGLLALIAGIRLIYVQEAPKAVTTDGVPS